MSEIVDLLSLFSVPGVGSFRMRGLVGHFGSCGEVLRADEQELSRVEGVDRKTAKNIKKKVDGRFVEDQLSLAEKHGVRLISFWNDAYPEMLK